MYRPIDSNVTSFAAGQFFLFFLSLFVWKQATKINHMIIDSNEQLLFINNQTSKYNSEQTMLKMAKYNV